MQKRIVCFGDSNTWGYDAENEVRFSETVRWPCRLQQWLGDAYQVIEEGLMGRTSVCDDPLNEGLNALNYIYPCLKSHAPLELVIIMLGTNDTKERFGLTAYNIAQGIARLARKAERSESGQGSDTPHVLVVAPPRINPGYRHTDVNLSMGQNCDVKSHEFPVYLEQLLAGTGIDFLDASEEAAMNPIDCMHLTKDGHRSLAEHIFIRVRPLL
ncbi:SGNH/GDSL hydrolase family protein [Barrientosiimonas marina]|uniref:GDSL-type esterase/lipase family protein n=1 Tax=Lentibacillus kimchii TaxID=1542911 RepID=A0ABW2UTN5_9BACI